MCEQLKYIIDSHLSKKLATAFDVHAHMRTDQITNGLVHAISTVMLVLCLNKMCQIRNAIARNYKD